MASCPEKLFWSVALMATLISFSANGFCQADEAPMTETELVTILRAAKVVQADSKLTASISGDEIIITTNKKDGASDEASKIEAVLIAKTVFDSVKNDAQRTKIILFDSKTNDYSEVAVKRAEVKMYGSGQLSEKELLSSLELKHGDADNSLNDTIKVAPGPIYEERIIVCARLMKLDKAGSGIKDLQAEFEKLEELAKAGDTAKIYPAIKELKMKISARERALKEAQRHEDFLSNRAAVASNQVVSPAPAVAGLRDSKIDELFYNPKTKRPLYSFGIQDLPRPMHGRGTAVWFMEQIHDRLNEGKDAQSSINTMNVAIHALNTNNSNQYESCMEALTKQLGYPTSGNKNNNPFGGRSFFPRRQN